MGQETDAITARSTAPCQPRGWFDRVSALKIEIATDSLWLGVFADMLPPSRHGGERGLVGRLQWNQDLRAGRGALSAALRLVRTSAGLDKALPTSKMLPTNDLRL
jgi:hypothetical protein